MRPHFMAFFRSADAAAARTAIGAGTSSAVLPATATLAEVRAGTVTATRMFTPDLLKEISGTTAARPTDGHVGIRYFDTTLGKPIWLKTQPSTWVDATGVTV